MRVLMTGGGTAGHVNPALAIAGIISDREESVIEFVGTAKGIESVLVPAAGYKLHMIDVRGISRSLTLKNFDALCKAYKAIGECKRIIKEFKPDVVIGTGGYVCWPVIRAAASLGIPTALHEANATPGLAIRSLRSKTKLIMLGFESAEKKLGKCKARIVLTGLPVKKGFRAGDKEGARRTLGIPGECHKVVVSFGGSLGADKINAAVLDYIDGYVRSNPDVYHIHASGKRSYDEFSARASEKGIDKLPNVSIHPYIDDMQSCLRAADVAVCRAGASTLAELSAALCPAVLIPSPNVTDDQQTKNARFFEKGGAAVLLPDAGLSGEGLANCIDGLLRGVLRATMASAMKTFDHPDCDDLIYRSVKGIL